MSLIHRRLGPGLVAKGYAALRGIRAGWREFLRLASIVTRRVRLSSIAIDVQVARVLSLDSVIDRQLSLSSVALDSPVARILSLDSVIDRRLASHSLSDMEEF